MSFKKSDSILILIGERKNELGGSVYYGLFNELGESVPKPNFAEVEKQIFALTDIICAGLVLSAHDISDGGLVTALCEMSFGNEIGFEIDLPSKWPMTQALFSETGGFVIEVEKDNLEKVSDLLKEKNIAFFKIGQTKSEKKLKVNEVMNLDLALAKKTWTEGLRNKL